MRVLRARSLPFIGGSRRVYEAAVIRSPVSSSAGGPALPVFFLRGRTGLRGYSNVKHSLKHDWKKSIQAIENKR
ncbi:MAG: hypothetical protein J0I76_12485 [Thiobacillus sp.]|nr:hypothetical protein [Thiobacillus sp.]